MLLMVLLSVLCADVALAQATPKQASKELYDAGVDLFEQADYPGALVAFQRAQELRPHPVILFNLAQTLAALGRSVEAVEAFDQLLKAPGKLNETRLAQARSARDEQLASVGEIEILVVPSGASVELDGSALGAAPLPGPVRVKAGPHRVAAVLQGHAPLRREVQVSPRAKAVVTLELSPTESAHGKLMVRTSIPAATVAIAGQVLAETPVVAPLSIAPGSFELTVSRPGYRTIRRAITLAPGQTSELELTLEEDPEAIQRLGASLVLDASEDNVMVGVDGRARGVYKDPIPVAPGPHRVTLERGGFRPVTREVVASASVPTTLVVRFSPTPETLVSFVEGAKARRVGGWVGVGVGVGIVGGMAGFLGWNEGRLDDAVDAREAFNLSTEPGGRCDSLSPGFDEASCSAQRTQIEADTDAAETRRVVGWIALGVGAAGAVTGLVLALTGDDPTRYDRPTTDDLAGSLEPLCTPLPYGLTLGLRGQF